MLKLPQRPHRSQKSPVTQNGILRTRIAYPSDALNLNDLERFSQDWLHECEYRQHSRATLEWRRTVVEKLLWFLREKGHTECGTSELRAFLSYLSNGHREENGRWGNSHFDRRSTRPLTARTIKDYHNTLRAMFNWFVNDGVIEQSPMARIAAPIHRPNQIQPFTSEQIVNLIGAARKSKEPERNEALLLLALDTGLRASEICGLTMKDLDLNNRTCRVHGKGNKYRSVFFGRVTAKALWRYLRLYGRKPNEPVFFNGFGSFKSLDRNGFRLLMRRLGQAAGIQAVRCSPHTLRHTFAISFLRNGGNIWSLKEMLGHTNIQMTLRYSAIADADIEAQHRLYSPADRLQLR